MRRFNSDNIPDLPSCTPRFDWNYRGPVDLEIGSGAGLYAIRYALAHTDRRLIAIERTQRFHRLWQRFQSHGSPTSLFPVRADAVNWIAKFVPHESLSRIIILYPNPYLKGRQKNLRWHNMPFFTFLLERLKPGGDIEFATNILDYYREASARFVEFGLIVKSEYQVIDINSARTHFELKYLRRGETCYNLKLIKPIPAHVSN